jgi:multidrug efflux pump subunit AcrA (membrane-fusion protein)
VAKESPGSALLRYFPVVIALDRTDPEKMRPGMSVRVEVQGEDHQGVVLAPRAALDLSTRRPRALLAQGGAVEIELGPCSAQECVVQSGLAAGTRLRNAVSAGSPSPSVGARHASPGRGE